MSILQYFLQFLKGQGNAHNQRNKREITTKYIM